VAKALTFASSVADTRICRQWLHVTATREPPSRDSA
jgi:hypothetical protein